MASTPVTRLLAIDPAAEREVSDTGVVVVEYTAATTPVLVYAEAVHGGYEGFRKWASDAPQADIVVCEKYVPFRAQGDPSPMLIEGVVRYLWPDVVLQPSSGKNSMIPDKVLKGLGMWSTEGHHKDVREAARHALVYLFKERHRPLLKEVSG